MDTLIAVTAFLGLGALLIAASVFTAAARRYVTGEAAREEAEALASDLSPYRGWTERSRGDRRRNRGRIVFPITVNGQTVSADRRRGDRRRGLAV